jgi:hypothetical protein
MEVERTLLFDPDLRGEEQPRPHPSIMPSLITTFFLHMGSDYSFLQYEDVVEQQSWGTLSNLLANCIAALATPYAVKWFRVVVRVHSELIRFNGVPAFTGEDLYIIGESFAYNARLILSRRLEMREASVELVNALVLVAWMEYKSGRLPGLSQHRSCDVHAYLNR